MSRYVPLTSPSWIRAICGRLQSGEVWRCRCRKVGKGFWESSSRSNRLVVDAYGKAAISDLASYLRGKRVKFICEGKSSLSGMMTLMQAWAASTL